MPGGCRLDNPFPADYDSEAPTIGMRGSRSVAGPFRSFPRPGIAPTGFVLTADFLAHVHLPIGPGWMSVPPSDGPERFARMGSR
jgi:hypothetical protein